MTQTLFDKEHFFNRRALLVLSGVFICVYALIVLFYVQTIPDLGVRTVFGTALKAPIRFDPLNAAMSGVHPVEGDEVVTIGDIPVRTWSDVLNAPFNLRNRLADTD